jgi:ABC-type multidrug transport system fused ATPase/permease subunit
MKLFKAKWGLVLKALVIVLPLIGLKVLVHHLGWDVLPVGTLTSALITGTFFVVAIILAGVMTDLKESERIVSEFAASVETLYNDARLMEPDVEVAAVLTHLRELIRTAIANFERRHSWKLGEVSPAIRRIEEDVRSLNQKGKPLSILLRMRSELTTLKKLSYRVESIKETAFLPAAHAIAEVGVCAIVLVLILSTIEPFNKALLIMGVISLLLTSTVLLIDDMDDPFGGYASVDMRVIRKLERFLDERQVEPPADR